MTKVRRKKTARKNGNQKNTKIITEKQNKEEVVEEISEELEEAPAEVKEIVTEETDLLLERALANQNSKKHLARVVIVWSTLIGTTLLAVFCGIVMALWDLERTPGEVFQVMFETPYVPAMATTGDGWESAEEITIVKEEDFSEDTETVEAETETEEEVVSETAMEETLAVTDEIAHVSTIVRAGHEDEMIQNEISERSSTSVIGHIPMDQIPVNNYPDPDANYPLGFTTVDVSYFDDALFIGDSRLHGLGMRSGTNATFYTAVGFQVYNYNSTGLVQTQNGKVPIFDGIPYDAFTKIYIKVGLNEMGMAEEAFESKYAELINQLRLYEPRAIIYIHAIIPVTAHKSATDPAHTNEKINARNEALKQFALEHKCYFIDISPVVTDADGCLKSEMTGDGIHMKASYMELWREYLRTHAVVVP